MVDIANTDLNNENDNDYDPDIDNEINEEELNLYKDLKYFKDNKDSFLELLKRLKFLIETILKEEDIGFYHINKRIKDQDSIKDKLKKKQLKIKNLQDLIGLRIVAYLKLNE